VEGLSQRTGTARRPGVVSKEAELGTAVVPPPVRPRFLVENLDPKDQFIPEDLAEEHRLIAKATTRFLEGEILPHGEAIERGDFGLVRRLMRGLGEADLIGIEIPTRYGGLGLGSVFNTVVSERMVRCPSFAVAHGVHSGLACYPLIFLASHELKERFLPRMASGEILGALASTEPEAGSDIFSIQTKVGPLQSDGAYRLNGTKMWISNAGFADVFMTFAQLDRRRRNFFLVERGEGVSTGAEEDKMGLRGSSTRAVHFDDVVVPADHCIGEPGSGQRHYAGILGGGRFKLAIGCVGISKEALKLATGYAGMRKQFGRPICEFPGVQAKLAHMALRSWVAESVIYRLAGSIDAAVDAGTPKVEVLGEHVAEVCIAKALASEYAGQVTDECVQVLGGCGYSRRYPAEQYYRDIRVFRIFEGTNEIMRLVIADQVRRMQAIRELEGRRGPDLEDAPSVGRGGSFEATLAGAKRIFASIARLGYERTRLELFEAQELCLALGDFAMEIYAMESGLVRLRKLEAIDKAGVERSLVSLLFEQAQQRIHQFLREAIPRVAAGAGIETLWNELGAAGGPPCDSRQWRSEIARAAADGDAALFAED